MVTRPALVNRHGRTDITCKGARVSSLVRIYRLKEFIRLNETGSLDVERSKKLIRQLAAAAAYHAADNILVDLRETTVESGTMADVLEVATEFARYESAFRGKIASVVPDDERRIAAARRFKDVLDIDPRRYEIFTKFEDAIDWLSDIEDGADNRTGRT